MRAVTALLPFLLHTAGAHAEAPWDHPDADSAARLHAKHCVSCHARMYGGDGSKMYLRDGRLLSTRQELLQRVAACNAASGAGWFPDEEANVAAWLNRVYYHFEQ